MKIISSFFDNINKFVQIFLSRFYFIIIMKSLICHKIVNMIFIFNFHPIYKGEPSRYFY